MNRLELGKTITELLLGKKVEGRIAAVLPNSDNQLSYIVDTGEEMLHVQIPIARYYTTIVPLPPLIEPELLREQHIKRRFFKVKPWVDGQII